jgi:hypothetical protein
MNEPKNYSEYILDIHISKDVGPVIDILDTDKKKLLVKFNVFGGNEYVDNWLSRATLERMNQEVPDEYKILLPYIEEYE